MQLRGFPIIAPLLLALAGVASLPRSARACDPSPLPSVFVEWQGPVGSEQGILLNAICGPGCAQAPELQVTVTDAQGSSVTGVVAPVGDTGFVHWRPDAALTTGTYAMRVHATAEPDPEPVLLLEHDFEVDPSLPPLARAAAPSVELSLESYPVAGGETFACNDGGLCFAQSVGTREQPAPLLRVEVPAAPPSAPTSAVYRVRVSADGGDPLAAFERSAVATEDGSWMTFTLAASQGRAQRFCVDVETVDLDGSVEPSVTTTCIDNPPALYEGRDRPASFQQCSVPGFPLQAWTDAWCRDNAADCRLGDGATQAPCLDYATHCGDSIEEVAVAGTSALASAMTPAEGAAGAGPEDQGDQQVAHGAGGCSVAPLQPPHPAPVLLWFSLPLAAWIRVASTRPGRIRRNGSRSAPDQAQAQARSTREP